jgi:hypothetical protein
MTQLTNFPVQQLGDRFGIGRSQVYSRMNQLGITPHTINRKSYLTIAELERLDDLDHYLKKGGTIQEFINKSGVDDTPDDSNQMIVNHDFQAILPPLSANLDDFRMLQEIVDNDWVIPTSRLAAITNLSPRTLQGKNEYVYCGFRFSKFGRQGSSLLWQVERV